MPHVPKVILLTPSREHANCDFFHLKILPSAHHRRLMPAIAQPSHFSHPEPFLYQYASLPKLILHHLAVYLHLHLKEAFLWPLLVSSLPIGQDVEFLFPPLLEFLRAPSLSIEDHRHTSFFSHQLPHLRKDLLLQHGKQAVVRLCRDEKERLGIRVIHPHICGRRHAEASPRNMCLRQLVRAAVVWTYMTVNVQKSQSLRLRPAPSLRKRGHELPREASTPHLFQFPPQCLHLRHSVHAQYDPQLSRCMRLQLLGCLDPAQCHKRQCQQYCTQSEEARTKGSVHLLSLFQQPL